MALIHTQPCLPLDLTTVPTITSSNNFYKEVPHTHTNSETPPQTTTSQKCFQIHNGKVSLGDYQVNNQQRWELQQAEESIKQVCSAVGRIEFGNKPEEYVGTGTFVMIPEQAEKLFMTCKHIIQRMRDMTQSSQLALHWVVNFGQEFCNTSSTLQGQATHSQSEPYSVPILMNTNGEPFEWCSSRIGGLDSNIGFLKLEESTVLKERTAINLDHEVDVVMGQRCFIVQYPWHWFPHETSVSGFKQFSYGTIDQELGAGLWYHSCFSSTGSSGSPVVLMEAGGGGHPRLLGIHLGTDNTVGNTFGPNVTLAIHSIYQTNHSNHSTLATRSTTTVTTSSLMSDPSILGTVPQVFAICDFVTPSQVQVHAGDALEFITLVSGSHDMSICCRDGELLEVPVNCIIVP